MVHNVNEHSRGNVIRLYRFIEENNKFVVKSELEAFSLSDAKSATSFASRLPNMPADERILLGGISKGKS